MRIQRLKCNGLGFEIRLSDEPTLARNFNSLKVTIETVYAFGDSRNDPPIRMCRHCGKAFMPRMDGAGSAIVSAAISTISSDSERKKYSVNRFFLLLYVKM